MNMQPYQVIYDITKTFPPIWFVVPMLFGVAVGVFLWRNAAQKQTHKIFIGLWMAGFIGLGSFGMGNVVLEHVRCVDWANNGDYQIVEGKVANFTPMPYTGHQYERFSVQGIPFKYSNYDQSKCGFNNTSSHGGPIQAGLDVRISYRDGRILKLEVAGPLPPAQKITPTFPDFPDSFPFGFFNRYFWAMSLVSIIIGLKALRKRSTAMIAQHPERAAGYAKLFQGQLVLMSIPWLVMGFGILFGGVKGVFSYFDLRSGDPFILAFYGVNLLLGMFFFVWVFFKNGAEFLVEHPGSFNQDFKSPSQVKIFVLLSLLGTCIGFVFLWYFVRF